MSKLKFYILDVFAEEKYAGNQLAVFRGAYYLSDSELQKIAKEINYSETTFIMSETLRDGGYDVRIFTPNKEIPFAGHPTLGTAYLIQHVIIGRPVESVVLNLKAGRIPVTFEYEGEFATGGTMKQKSPIFGKKIEASHAATAVGLGAKDIDERFPVEEVSTGLPFVIVPVRTREAVRRASINKEIYMNLIKNIDAKAILIFCAEPYDPFNDLNVRVFADYYGVPEDPATGSANGCLAAWLIRHRFFGEDRIDMHVEQGYEIGRRSLLHLKAEKKGSDIEIYVGGKVKPVAEGVFF